MSGLRPIATELMRRSELSRSAKRRPEQVQQVWLIRAAELEAGQAVAREGQEVNACSSVSAWSIQCVKIKSVTSRAITPASSVIADDPPMSARAAQLMVP